jgi:hypothetical protein
MIEPIKRGQERTYAYAGGTIPIRCEQQSVRTISTMAGLTRWTMLDIPGKRDSGIPPQVLAILDDLTELRFIAFDKPWNAEAQTDVIEADLERHLNAFWHELHRNVLFGAYQLPDVPQPDIDPCGFGGADVAAMRSKRRQPALRDSWIAMVVVPPQIARCTLVTPLERRN